MFALAFVASFLVAPSLASLSIVGSQTSTCPGGLSDQGDFTLLAVSKAYANKTTPLVLGSRDPRMLTRDVAWIGGKCDMPVVLSSNFTMSNGGIMATTPQGLMVGGSNSVSNESYYLSFGFAENTTSTPPVSLGVYCVMPNPNSHPEFPCILTLNEGDGDKFSLCRLSGGSNESLVVYNAVDWRTKETEYDFNSCENITIAVIKS